MSSIVMDGNSNGTGNQNLGQLAMINDSGGGAGATHVTHNNQMDPVTNHNQEVVVVNYEDRADDTHYHAQASGGAPDLIATALDAANISAQDGTMDTLDSATDGSTVGGQQLIEEGIIYRSPAVNAVTSNAAAANSKVHFISNLTLIAKQQQTQQSQAQATAAASRAGQNIIFLNNAPSSASSLVAAGKGQAMQPGTTSSYINAFVSKGGATPAGKVVNLLHAGQKSTGQSLIPSTSQHQQRMGKNVQVLKRLPVQQPNVIGRGGSGIGGQFLHASHVSKVGGTMQSQKPQNVVITGSSSLIGGGKGMASGGKLINTTGLHSNATMKVVNSNGQQKGTTVTSHKYARGTGHVLQSQQVGNQKVKSVVSKYQPKVVQVQQPHASGVLGGTVSYTTVGSGPGGAHQWRVDMRGRAPQSNAEEQVVIGPGAEMSGVVQRPITVQGTAIATSPTKVITMNSNKFAVQQPMLVMSGGVGQGGGTPGGSKGVAGNYTTHTVQMASHGQYSVIGEDGQPQASIQVGGGGGSSGGAIKYVNAQGNVIQQQQHHQNSVKYKTTIVAGPDGNDQHHHHHQQLVHNVIQYGGGGGGVGGKKSKLNMSQQQVPAEDVYYVNGTQMNDEMSARLLQSFSQKASSRYAAAQAATTGGASGAHHVKYQYSAAGAQNSYEGYPQSSVQLQGSQKHGPEYFRVNTSDVQTTTTTFIDNIPLTTRLEDLPLAVAAHHHQHKDGNNNGGGGNGAGVVLVGSHSYLGHPSIGGHQGEEPDQDDIMGVEMRPAPISSTDERMKALHAVLQDHTYVLQRPGDQKPGASGPGSQSQGGPVSRLQYAGSHLDNKELGIAMALAEVGNGALFHQRQQQQQQQQHHQPIKCTTTDLLNAAMGLGHYPLSGGQMDDDNCSVISNDSRSGARAGENDLGEETETAPEGDGEDDSVTRCICDLTHDDGYMICCDKCSTWQHVDCMGIDRMNIPDEYICDVCHPRAMDKNRARMLQLSKRREQQNAALMHSMAMNGGLPLGAGGQFGGGGVIGLDAGAYGNGMLPLIGADGRPLAGSEAYHRNKLGAVGSPLKKVKSQLARRKSELGSTFSVKKQKRDMMKNGGLAGKRKEKKTMTKKRTASAFGSAAKQAASALPSTTPTEEKQGLKSWIDNYEKAITNHYSPELRARLQAIGKQQQQLLMSPGGKSSLCPAINLKNVGDLSDKCTTVPHAGGKILISTLEVLPNVPIVELRGKYMLSGQYRQHNSTTTGGRNQSSKPGPFLFFYRLVNDATELCVDTRTYGNDARFVRRSCRPNAEIVHHLEKGTIHLYIVSLQPIRSSTEITIKHEPHDLLAVSRANAAGSSDVPQPTSTACACGLVKDCLFFNANATAAVPGLAGDGVKPGKRLNGHVQKTRTTSTSRGGGGEENTGPVRRSKANMRNSRSTSSSGESSVCLMSPNIGNGSLPMHPGRMLSPPTPVIVGKPVEVISNGVIVLPPSEEEVVEKKPTNLTSLAAEPLMTIVKQELAQQSVEVKPEPVVEVMEEKEEEVIVAEADHLQNEIVDVVTVKKEEEPKSEPLAQCKVESKEGIASVSQASLLKSAESTMPHKRNKELKSLSEENLKAPPSSNTPKVAAEESRKLTREERKMQAIMKAFEKMEKSSMRKQEGRKSGGSCGSSETPGKRRDSTSTRKDPDDRSIFKRKKRKGSKSYQQANTRRIQRKSQTMSNDDVFTSEESTGSLLASPPISVPYTYQTTNPLLPIRPNYGDSGKFNGEQNSAANMLLSLANASPAGTPSPSCAGPMSSVFMLVEAAIAPLEASSDFKVPKTKKSIMNDWLSADKSSGGSSPQGIEKQPFESLIQAVQTVHGDEPQNLCKKVEEFIIQTGDHLKVDSPGDPNENRVPLPFPTPPSTGGSESAVKKRWLRQAISEECSDEAPQSPTNGYAATPLKKRRFARHCSDFAEDLSPSTPKQFVNSCTNSPAECSVDDVKPFEEFDLKREKEEPVEEEIDVINSPKECAPLVREDEMVKIEPENEAEKDIRINVEDEEGPEEVMPTAVDDEVKVERADPVIEPVNQIEEVRAPEVQPVKPVEPKEIIPEEFDIEPLNPEEKTSSSDIALPESASVGAAIATEDASDEIADIQKRLHSFHTENILFLKSMNKKTKPNPSPECLSAYSSASVSASSSAASSPISSPKSSTMADVLSTPIVLSAKRKKLDFDSEEVTKETADDDKCPEPASSPEKRKRRTKSRFSSPIPGGIELKDLNSNTVGVMKDSLESAAESGGLNMSTFKPPEVAVTPPTHSYYTTGPASYSTGAGHHSIMAPQMGMINTSIPPPHLSYPSMFNAYGVTPGADMSQVEPPAASSRLLLSELLENAQKINHQSFPEIAQTNSFSSSLADHSLRPTSSTILSGSVQSGFFTLNSSPGLSKMTFNSEPSLTTTATSSPAASRTLIRTASADPRLNPNLNAAPETPPAPKRKLSINEYRKRMQQTSSCGSESNSSSAAASPTGGSSRDASGEKCSGMDLSEETRSSAKCDSQMDVIENNILDSLVDLKEDDSNSCGSSTNPDGMKTPTEAKVTFSAAPTLLERQQESISERLRNYKSVTELLTTKDGAPIISTILQNNPLGNSIIESLRSTAIGGITGDGSNVGEERNDGDVFEGERSISITAEDQPSGGEEASVVDEPMTTAAAAR